MRLPYPAPNPQTSKRVLVKQAAEILEKADTSVSEETVDLLIALAITTLELARKGKHD